MPPLFHTDHILCRLITTYFGKGTEWLDSHPIDPTELATYNEAHSDQPYLGKIPCFHLQSGDIALFKGDRWKKSIGNPGVIHRSPQLDQGEVRLLLTLDIIS